MTAKLMWITGVLALACCMTTLGQAEDDDALMPIHYTALASEDEALSQLAEPDDACEASVDLDRAYELDATGRIKTEWPLPAAATPLAINGNRLLVHQYEAGEEFVFVTPEGDMGTTLIDPPEAPALDDESKDGGDCPALSDQWDTCSRFVDVATGSLRTIAYRLQCT